ncbi:MAG: insulinase family protein [Caldilineaceae bacterium]|nr:insulinase family protein [Caldilineaceae bacterium]
MTNALPSPENIQRVVFNNGMTVLARENHSAPVVVLEGSLAAGSIQEPASKAGLCSYVTAMLTRGSVHYTFDQFNDAIESIGASLSFSAGAHNTSFGITCLAEDFPQLVQVLADVLRNPTFPEEQIERVRRQKLVRLQEREQDTGSMAHLRFGEALYGQDHPYGRAVSGYTETVSTINRTDLELFHQKYFTPNGAIVAVSGDVQFDALVELLTRSFGDWHGLVVDQGVPPIHFPQAIQRIVHPMPGKFQSDIVIGCPAVARSHPDYDALRVANTILGRFGMMGRLGETVREEQGLAYYCSSALQTDLVAGAWVTSAGVNPANVEQAIDSILAEFQRLAHEPVTAQELSDSQAYMTGIVPLSLETNAGVAQTLYNMEWFNLGLDYLQRYSGLINAITVEDVQRVAQTYLRGDAYALVVAGPHEV